MIEVVAKVVFGLEGTSGKTRLNGFSYPEHGQIWSIGCQSSLNIDLPLGRRPTMIEVDLMPCVFGANHPRQRLTIRVNGIDIATESVEREGALGYWLPEGLELTSTCLVEFVHPDAVRPRDLGVGDDDRELAFMFRSLRFLDLARDPPVVPRKRAPLWNLPASGDVSPEMTAEVLRKTGLSVRDFMFEFESLGWNCELGMLQRRCEAEPLALLRFSGITLPCLLKGLDDDFSGIDDPQNVRLIAVGGEYLLRNDVYDMTVHTWRHEGKDDANKVVTDTLRSLKFYRRKFREDLESAERLYVIQRPGQLLPAQARVLLTAMRRVGDCALLIVSEDPDRPSGMVEQLEAHLFRGYIREFAPGQDLAKCDLPAWLSICLNAWSLWKGEVRDQTAITPDRAAMPNEVVVETESADAR